MRQLRWAFLLLATVTPDLIAQEPNPFGEPAPAAPQAPAKPKAPENLGLELLPTAPAKTPAGKAPAAKPGAAAEKEPVERTPVKIDVKHFGRPEGKELDVSMRYYLWTDADGWHIRSACKHGTYAGFQGIITVTDGTFEKIRPIALETKKGGKTSDGWRLSEDRTRLEFVMYTGDRPDGFDYTIKGTDAVLTYDLKIGNKERPKQIYIGNDNQHPSKAYFQVPAAHR